MGYLSNTLVEVDAILTNKGKELLSKGATNFKITQFALSDDEIDYRLWNPDHNLGTTYYGEMIENMPIIEATPVETQIMKHKLITLPKTTTRIPLLSIGATTVTLNTNQTYTITPITVNLTNANDTLGYTAILSNSDAATIRPTPGFEVTNVISTNNTTNTTTTVGAQESVTVTGKKFDLVAKLQRTNDLSATVTIMGNETGGKVVLHFTVVAETI